MDGITCLNCDYRNVFYCESMDIIWDGQAPIPIEEALAFQGDVVEEKLQYQLSQLDDTTYREFAPTLGGRRVVWSECHSALVHCRDCHTLDTTPVLTVKFLEGDRATIWAEYCEKCHHQRIEVSDENLEDITCPSCRQKSLNPFQVIY